MSQMKALRFFSLCLTVFILASCDAGAMSQNSGNRLEVPFGRLTRLPSPDGRYVLIGASKRTSRPSQKCPKCFDISSSLWLEDRPSHTRKLLLNIGSTASSGWSPDGSAFFVEDHEGSNLTDAYIYETANANKLDIMDRVLAADPGATRLVEGHRYFNVDRWQDNDNLLIRFVGHTDESPFTCFRIRYLVSRTGEVKRLSQRTGPPDAAWCHY